MYLNHLATLQCTHGGQVLLFPPPFRSFNIMQSPVVTDMDLLEALIVGCPQIGPGIKPCTKIITILLGQSLEIQVDGEIPILDSLQALTDGVPPGIVTAITDGGSNATPAPLQAAVLKNASQTGAALADVCQPPPPAVVPAAPRRDNHLGQIAARGAPSLAPISASGRKLETSPEPSRDKKRRLIEAQDAALKSPAFKPGPEEKPRTRRLECADKA